MTPYLTSAKKNVHLFVESCVLAGLKTVVISPGSRNAPLTIAFDEHPEIDCLLIHDERSAAFFALGIILQRKTPVAVLCTSGSAVVNYYPAVTEAYYQCQPLVVISADRPQEWINHGDGQTIMQREVFGSHVHQYLELSDAELSEKEQVLLCQNTQAAIYNACNGWRGPIHINFALEEPLYGTVEVKEVVKIAPLQILTSDCKAHEDIHDLKEIWSKASRKMILCGQMPKDDALLHQLQLLSEDPSVIILVENTANLVHMNFIHCIDRTIGSIKLEDLQYQPDVLISIGGAVVSKKIKALLREWDIHHHWRVSSDFPEMDTFRHLTKHFLILERDFVRQLNQFPRGVVANYGQKWKQLDFLIQDKARVYLDGLKFSDLKVFDLVLDCLPEHSHLHLANSSVVRYGQLFDPIRSVQYYSNRGTSGIDGSTSTAVGSAFAKQEDWQVLITGDISFFYDSNALWNAHLTPNLRIVMINNGGGGIFKIIPGPHTTKQYKSYFVAEQGRKANLICETFDVEYFSAETSEELLAHMDEFWTYEEKGRPKLMEVMTNSVENEKDLERFFDFIKQDK
jgi:2-succinyl-5-enolpyruvyl-6-hydroxy-3-cyclohexene-1-carboxylate synthase